MLPSDPPVLFWILTAVHLLGLVGAVLARSREGSSGNVLCLTFFLACLLLVGLTTMAFLRMPSGAGVFSGFTLGAMIVGTTCEFRRSPSTSVA